MNKEEYEELKRILLSHGLLEEDVEAILEFVKNGGNGGFFNENK